MPFSQGCIFTVCCCLKALLIDSEAMPLPSPISSKRKKIYEVKLMFHKKKAVGKGKGKGKGKDGMEHFCL